MNLDLMRLIDKQFLATLFYGLRQMTWHLRNEGHVVNEKTDQAPDATDGPHADLSKAKHQQDSEGVKWRQKTGRLAKVYPNPLRGYENGKAPKFYRSV